MANDLPKPIQTSGGDAIILRLPELPTIPNGVGVIVHCRDRHQFGEILLKATNYKWIADYCPKSKGAIVLASTDPFVPVRSLITFDLSIVLHKCPKCGDSDYIHHGERLECKQCGRQWKPDAKPRGGVRLGAGRKKKILC